jgi:hypothetical protein
MALPASGPISFSQLNNELSKIESRSTTSPISLNTLNVRRLLKTQTNPSSNTEIKISEARSKSSTFDVSFSNVVNAVTGTGSGQLLFGWNGVARPIITVINASASSTSNAAITVSGSYIWGITLRTYGAIYGRGAPSRYNRFTSPATYDAATFSQTNINGLPGGAALLIQTPCRLENFGTIAGGGGSGGNDRCEIKQISGAYFPNIDVLVAGGAGQGGGPEYLPPINQEVEWGLTGALFFSNGRFTVLKTNFTAEGETTISSGVGNGGLGGSPGSAGGAAASTVAGAGGAGGAAGNSVKGTNFITFSPQGTLLGPTSPT